ncbi:putative membrane protein [Mesorhizobium sp. J18]|uniref:NnrU family protein n=1 Tax=Mesorhizobium sp. J18 TaxID=935263 RepID=UPI00119A7EB1|nr:NnrU family protein [Mesorhizobium sp. J18]TWG99301.1 putative membrane protein [Mesorhizobium sp. J18]
MSILVLGLVLFLGAHSVRIVAPGIRSGIIERGGMGAWMIPYAAVSVIGLVLIVIGYGVAREAPVIVTEPPAGLRHLALALMLPVFPLLLAAYLPGRIRARLRHPMLIATVIWGVAHLLANGTLADILLFGGFALWALIDIFSISGRSETPARTVKVSHWRNDLVAVVAGLAIYAAFVARLHDWLVGVSPI